MDSKLLGFACFLSVMTLGTALKCHMCGSHESMSLCMKYKTTKECDVWEDRCYKAQVDEKIDGKAYRVYQRGCASEWQCSKKQIEMCKGPKGQSLPLNCDVNCCSGDFCNGGTLPAVSALVLVACALLLVLMNFGW